jgi:GDP-4-dehydro-6-deoxy-D-mannose reductase
MVRAVRHVQPARVIHLAALTNGAQADAIPLIDTNVGGTLNILEALARHVPAARVCVVGSSAEYGWVTKDECPIREEQPLRPVSIYGISKAAQSLVAQRSWLRDRLPTVRTRTFNLIGPGQPDSLVPGSFARQVAEAELGLRAPEVVTGPLSDYRDFVDVRDAARAYWMLVQQGEPGAVYNVCSGRAVQIGEILDILLGSARCRVSVRAREDPQIASRIPYQSGSHRRLLEQTGWEPRIPLQQSVRDVLAYWRRVVRDRQTNPGV